MTAKDVSKKLHTGWQHCSAVILFNNCSVMNPAITQMRLLDSDKQIIALTCVSSGSYFTGSLSLKINDVR